MFESKSLNKAQQRYPAFRKELLAVVFGLHKAHEYIYLTHFKLFTDHKALTFLLTQQHLNNMLNDWLAFILEYDFEIVHLPGILNVVCDSLSRQYPEYVHESYND